VYDPVTQLSSTIVVHGASLLINRCAGHLWVVLAATTTSLREPTPTTGSGIIPRSGRLRFLGPLLSSLLRLDVLPPFLLLIFEVLKYGRWRWRPSFRRSFRVLAPDNLFLLHTRLVDLVQSLFKNAHIARVGLKHSIENITNEWNDADDEIEEDVEQHLDLVPKRELAIDLATAGEEPKSEEKVAKVAESSKRSAMNLDDRSQ